VVAGFPTTIDDADGVLFRDGDDIGDIGDERGRPVALATVTATGPVIRLAPPAFVY
jgi:hypothetical protein